MAVVIQGAVDCAATRSALQDVLASFPEGEVTPVPRVLTEEPGARPYQVGEGTFIQGFYWYNATPEEALAYRMVAKHFEQEALRVLRKERGLTYSPQSFFERRGYGGRLWIAIKSGQTGDVASWYQDTLQKLKAAKRPTEYLAEAMRAVRAELENHAVESALVHLREEPPFETQFDELTNSELKKILARILVDNRAFGSVTPQTNAASLIILGLFSLGVLAIFGYAFRSFLSGG